ncbi:hypothetical protein DFQ03_1603 [Maribacter caenipelagi]|uniref:Chemoreceptor-like protein with four helix bundle sensory module n=1 Tax=Maribacter caenipelagi TaxID=1447781 RepID=A0A4R7D7Z6_9FLAO|nr:hypothetical protein [Maribacter caenipelagi]TDS17110.1 hypothetical protein DFQ03_1603 [Maribacter caenipelagi]
MFKKLKTPHRMQAGFILAIAFLLVLGSNRLYQRHFSTLQNTVNSVYEDRIKVQDYIYQLSNIFNQKKIRFITEGDFALVTDENKKTEKLLSNFALTKLTTKEYNTLNELTLQFDKLKKSEKKVMQSKDNLRSGVHVLSLKTLEQINQNLNVLARIQLEESRQMTQRSNKTLDTKILMSKLELGFLIAIGLALLALIFYPLKTKLPVLDH